MSAGAPEAPQDIDVRASRILIVDDEPANLELLETLLAREGFTQVLGSSQSERCVDLVQAFEPDLLLLDLWMPEVDGFELLARLARPALAERFMPVVVLTADASRRTRHQALGLGARDFLTKPFDPLEVLLRVWNQLETVQLFRRLRAHEPRVPAPGSAQTARLTRNAAG